MKTKLILFIFIVHSSGYADFIGGYAANLELIKQQRTASANDRMATSNNSATSTANASPSNCDCAQSATPTAMPCLVIDLFNSANNAINMYTFATNNSFSTAASVLLQVDIFPPSNTINNGIVSSMSQIDDYAIAYTLKSLDGALFQKFFQYNKMVTPTASTTACQTFITPASGSSSTAPIILNPAIQPTQFPVSMAISSPTSSTPPGTSLTAIAQNTFLTFPEGFSAAQKQQWFNNASPITQQFLIIPSANQAPTVTPISGSYNSIGSTAQSPFSTSNQASNVSAPAGSPLPTLTCTIADNSNNMQQFSFGGSSSKFNTSDLANGLILMIYAYPATNGGSLTSVTDVLVAILKTTDGLKFHKQVRQGSTTPITFNPAPCTLTLANGSTQIFTTTFLYPSINSAGINLAAPLSCRMILQGSSSAINVTQVP